MNETELSKRRQSRWNHYRCQKCHSITIARHDDEGVTPFMIRCRAKDVVKNGIRAQGCKGLAESAFFMGPQDDGQKAHVVFYRPKVGEAILEIGKMPERVRGPMLEHYNNGGSLMRDVAGSDVP